MAIQQAGNSSNLLEVLENILDKGVVIAGDIKILLTDIELLTIKIRLIVASVDKAKEIGLDWWESDPYLSSRAKQNQELTERVKNLEKIVGERNE